MTILTVAEVSKEYNIPRQTLYSAIREGRLETLRRSGATILLMREAVETFVNTYEERQSTRPQQAGQPLVLGPKDPGQEDE
jgi:excisionase family DNA binding protein